MTETPTRDMANDHPASWPTAGTHAFLRWLIERRAHELSRPPAVRVDDEPRQD